MTLHISVKKSFGLFSLEIEQKSEAKVLGIFGPSGSGKSTLLNCIAGIVEPDGGQIAVAGNTLTDVGAGASVPLPKRRIGYVFQDSLLFPHFSVERNLRYAKPQKGGPSFEEVVGILEIEPLLGRMPATLSGGQARRVALGRALLSDPQLLLLDEPLSGLDRELSIKTLHYLKRIVQKFSIPMVYVSHTASDVLYLCEDVWMLDGGRVVGAGKPRNLITNSMWARKFDDSDLYTLLAGQRVSTSLYRAGGITVHGPESGGDDARAYLLSLHADDIIIARERPGRISARNVLPAHVTGVVAAGRECLITLQVDPQIDDLLVRATPGAVAELGLAPGAPVFAIIKATSIHAVPI